MAPGPIAIRPADPTAPEEFRQLIEIYEACIPASGRKPADAVRGMCGREDYQVLIAGRDGRVLGFAIGYLAQGAPIGLLEYLGVRAEARSGGIGARLFQAVAERTAATGRRLLIEVETDLEPGHDLEDARRRKAFYRRLGCRQLMGLSYRMPQIGDEPPGPMDLLVHGEGPATIARTAVRSWLAAVYEEVYGQPAGHPAIGEMLASMPDPIALV